MITYEYEVMYIGEVHLNLIKELLDRYAKDGWRLVAVSSGIAYLERAISV